LGVSHCVPPYWTGFRSGKRGFGPERPSSEEFENLGLKVRNDNPELSTEFREKENREN
jgi:hypothetical protein